MNDYKYDDRVVQGYGILCDGGNRSMAICDRYFESDAALEAHRAFADNHKTCRLCLTEFDSIEALKGHLASHFRIVGDSDFRFGCPLCTRSYKGVFVIVKHVLHHDVPVSKKLKLSCY
jgi:hypothetical protein